jgi:hypothetical protein
VLDDQEQGSDRCPAILPSRCCVAFGSVWMNSPASRRRSCLCRRSGARAPKVGGSDQTATLALRATSVFRLEHDVWKLVHRHADSITTPRPAASVINQKQRVIIRSVFLSLGDACMEARRRLLLMRVSGGLAGHTAGQAGPPQQPDPGSNGRNSLPPGQRNPITSCTKKSAEAKCLVVDANCHKACAICRDGSPHRHWHSRCYPR